MLRKAIEDYIEDRFPDHMKEILLADGFDEAFIGIGQAFTGNPVAIYDTNKCIDIIMCDIEADESRDPEDDVMTMAIEHFEYNVIGSFVGDFTPMFVTPFILDDYKPEAGGQP